MDPSGDDLDPYSHRKLGRQLSKLDTIVMEWATPTCQSALVRPNARGGPYGVGRGG